MASFMFEIQKKNQTHRTENRIVVARGQGGGEWGDVNQRVQTYSYKMKEL